MSKRNDALNVISAQPAAPREVPPAVTAKPIAAVAAEAATDKKVTRLPKASKTVDKVMLYLPPKVARKFKEMAFHEDRKAHDLYLEALTAFLRSRGHSTEADLLARKLAEKN